MSSTQKPSIIISIKSNKSESHLYWRYEKRSKMGLKNLGVVFKNKKLALKEYKTEGWLSEFSGTRIAIDGPIWMHSYMATSQKQIVQTTDLALETPDHAEVLKLWLDRAIEYIKSFLTLDITPIFVFDGTSVPEKDKTKQKRRDVKGNIATEIELLEREKATHDILKIPDALTQRLRDLYKQLTGVSTFEIEMFMGALRSIGIPVVQATGESEQLCSLLCIEGICSAVISKDADCYAFGCPLLITELSGQKYNTKIGKYDRTVTKALLSDLLRAMGMTFETFLDFAIMSGCDFNQNIKDIGGVKCYNLMKEYHSIDNLPDDFKKNHDLTVLNYIKCREIFKVVEWKERYVSGGFDLSESAGIRDVLESIGCSKHVVSLDDLMHKCARSKDRGFRLLPNRKVTRLNIVG